MTQASAPSSPPTLSEMTLAVYECNVANGWFEDERSIGEEFALIHTEIAEATEAFRSWGLADMTESECRTFDHSHPTPVRSTHLCKPEGVGSELADVVVRILDTAHRRKIAMSWNTLVDVEPLELDGQSFADHMEHLHRLAADRDLSPLLAGVVFVADCATLDLQAEFDRKLAYNLTRGHKHGGKLL